MMRTGSKVKQIGMLETDPNVHYCFRNSIEVSIYQPPLRNHPIHHADTTSTINTAIKIPIHNVTKIIYRDQILTEIVIIYKINDDKARKATITTTITNYLQP